MDDLELALGLVFADLLATEILIYLALNSLLIHHTTTKGWQSQVKEKVTNKPTENKNKTKIRPQKLSKS